MLTINTVFNKSYLSFRGIFREIESDEKNYHSAYLVSGIRDILGGEKPYAIGINVGPGSFTGIRVGVTVARVMGQQLGCPLVPVSSCEIIKKAVALPVVMDARRGSYYFYDKEISLIPREALKDTLKKDVACDENSFKMLCELGFSPLNFEEENIPYAKCLEELAKEKLESASEDFHWSRLKPLYIQTPPIHGR